MKRIRYYNLLRVVCFGFIIFYHMMVQLRLVGSYPEEIVNRFVSNENMHMATLAVAVFFMLSGAGLSYGSRERFELKKYYQKRVTRILIPFYLVMLLALCERVIRLGGIANVYPANVPLWRIIFTLFGMDEWVSMHGVATFSLGIGEWFLGCLVVLYLIYPVLRWVMIKAPVLFAIVMTGIYLGTICLYHGGVPMHMNLLVKGYEFCIGMMFGQYLVQFPKWLRAISVVVVAIFVLCPVALPVSMAIRITVLAVSFFIAMSCLETFLERFGIINKIIDWISGCSYELYLVHHEVIYMITPLAVAYLPGAKAVLALFIVQIVVIFIVAFAVKSLIKLAVHLCHAKKST